jgi:tetratricopeptide (TPR) repeat protein
MKSSTARSSTAKSSTAKRSMALLFAALVWFMGGALLGCVGGCAGERNGERQAGESAERSTTRLPDPSGRDLPELGEPLMIALAQAKNFHHKADVYLREGQLDDAIDAVAEILAVPFPQGAPEAEDVMLDARARLAKLLSAQGKAEEAMKVVDQGIAGAGRRSFFLANLYTVKGEVFEAMAIMLDDQETEKATAQARAARRQAIEAFDQSIAINTALQRALMGEAAP